jgi:hypothetical protein
MAEPAAPVDAGAAAEPVAVPEPAAPEAELPAAPDVVTFIVLGSLPPPQATKNRACASSAAAPPTKNEGRIISLSIVSPRSRW